MDENELIKKAQKGSEEAFEEIVRIYEKKVYSIALRMTGNQEDAYDAAQEVFIKIYSFLPSFKWESNFYTWVYRITVNKCIDMTRKQKRHKVISIDGDGDETPAMDLPDESMSPDSSYTRKEMLKEVEKAIEKLSDEHKTVIVLRDIKGMSYAEIADIVGVNEGTVKSRISRARDRLREILTKKGNFFEDRVSK